MLIWKCVFVTIFHRIAWINDDIETADELVFQQLFHSLSHKALLCSDFSFVLVEHLIRSAEIHDSNPPASWILRWIAPFGILDQNEKINPA